MSQTTPSFVHRNLPRLLLEAREAVMQHTRPSLREHGLSDPQWRVLRVLGEHAGDPAGVETGRVVRATPAGLKLVPTLSQTIEVHCAWMEEQLGKAQLAKLYVLLDQVIALEAPGGEATCEDTSEDDTE